MDNPTTTQYANLMHNFILKARSTVREIDPQNDLTFLRIRSKKNEIMVAPGKGSLYCLCTCVLSVAYQEDLACGVSGI